MPGFEAGSVFGQVVQVFQNAAGASADAEDSVRSRRAELYAHETDKATAAERAQGLIEQSAQKVKSAAQAVRDAEASLTDTLREEVLALNAVEEAAKSRAASILKTLPPVIPPDTKG